MNFDYDKYTMFSADELAERMSRPKTSTIVREISKEGRVYLESLKQAEKKNKTTADILAAIRNEESRKNKVFRQVISYKEARPILWEIMKLRLEKQGRKFVGEPSEILIIQNLLKYFICDPSSEYDLTKGIFLFGNTGVGKTFLMECFKTFVDKTKCRDGFQMIKTSELAEEMAKGIDSKFTSPLKIREKYKNGNWFFDDLGDDEPLRIVNYGNEIGILGNILTKREADFMKNGANVTHLTSNLLPLSYEVDGVVYKDEILERYGQRLRSRMESWFNFILWDGPDKRYL